MSRIATITALVALAGATFVATSGAFAPDPVVVDGGGVTSTGGLDRRSAGILGGAFIGAAVALLSHALVSTALKLSTEAAFKALTVGFFAKFLGAVLPWAALTFLPQAGRLADSTTYLVAFAIVVILVLGGGLFDHLKAVSSGGLSNAPGAATDHGLGETSPEIKADSSDHRSGSAFSLPRKLIGSPQGAGTFGSASSVAAAVPFPVHPPGSSDSLESAT